MLEISMYLDEDDLHEGQSMHEVIMRYLMHHGIMGASLFAATMGYGHRHHLHHRRGLGTVDERPIMIVFIDEASKIQSVIPHLRKIVRDGLIVAKTVEQL